MKTYAFIDSQNLNLGMSKELSRNGKVIYSGWKLDFKKFRRYLSDKFRVDKAFLYKRINWRAEGIKMGGVAYNT